MYHYTPDPKTVRRALLMGNRTIPLYKKKEIVGFMLCSVEDYGHLSKHRWGVNNKGYPMRWVTRRDGATRNIDPAHDVVGTMLRDGHVQGVFNQARFDHKMVCARINFDRKDVRRENLRPVTATVRARI